MSKKYQIVFSDGSKGYDGDFPIAVCREQENEPIPNDIIGGGLIADPIFNWQIKNNLYGRIMTLVEATTDVSRLKAVKDVFSKELEAWSNEVYRSAREKASGNDSSINLYNK